MCNFKITFGKFWFKFVGSLSIHGLIGYDRRTNFSPALHALRRDLMRAMVNLPEKAPTNGEAPGTGATTTPTTQAELRKNALCKHSSGTEGMETTIAKAGAASSPEHTASFPPTTPFVCTLACYACTDPGSTAPTHAYSWDPVESGIYMHTSCFLNFTAWVETQTNLRDILHAWLLCSRRAHSLRSMRALKCVRRWQRDIKSYVATYIYMHKYKHIFVYLYVCLSYKYI